MNRKGEGNDLCHRIVDTLQSTGVFRSWIPYVPTGILPLFSKSSCLYDIIVHTLLSFQDDRDDNYFLPRRHQISDVFQDINRNSVKSIANPVPTGKFTRTVSCT